MKIDKTAKKILALILSLALLLSIVIVPGVVGAIGGEGLDIWDGTYVQPTDGDGDGVLEIYTPEELAWFVKNHGRKGEGGSYPAATAKLMNDIWLNDMLVTVEDGVPSATKATDTSVVIDLADDENNGLREWFDGTNDMWFVGKLDGNNHVVNGLYVKHNQEYSPNSYGAGLIPRLGAAVTIKNLGVENSYMNTTADYTSAFIVGSVHSAKGTVMNCYAGESCYHTGKKAAAIVGGGGHGALVKDCYNLATIVKSNESSGVIIGDSWGGERIYNCYTAHGYKLTRPGYEAKAVDSYSLTAAPAKEDITYLGGAYLLEEGKYPVLRSFVEGADKGWNGLQEKPLDLDGDGLLEVSNASAFYYATLPGTKQTSFEITEDIIFNDITVKIEDGVGVIYDAKGNKVEDYSTLNQWHTGGTVVNTVKYYGNNHTVRGIFSNHTYEGGSANNQGVALANMGWDVDFYDLGLEDMYISVTGGTAAGFVANLWDQQGNDISGCYLAESVYLYGSHAGGVFGCGAGSKPNTVKDSYVLATVKASGKAGALTGDVWGCGSFTVTNTYATTKFWGNNPGVETNSYGGVTASNIVGGKAPATMPNLSGFVVTAKYPTLASFCEPTNVWSGWKTKPTAGTGSAADPFIITNGEELAFAIHNTASIYVEDAEGTYKYDEESATYVALTEGEAYEGTLYSYVAPSYKLANDIYLNDIDKIDWKTGAVTEGYGARTWYQDTAVRGTFDGDGHVVYGLYYNGTPGVNWGIDGSVALFPRILDGATLNVSKLGVDKAYVSAYRNASAFVGSNSANNQTEDTKTYYHLSESFTGADVTLKSYLTGSAVAGLRDLHANISDCYFLDTQYGSVATSNYGITGDAWSGSARYYRVFSPTQPLSSKNGNIAAQSNAYTYIGAPNAGTEVSDLAMKGEAPLATMAGLGDKFVTTEGYPTLRVFLDEVTEANKTLGTPAFEGAGTEDDPYLVSDAADLKAMVGLGGKNAYYKLTNDIYVNDVNAVDWKTGTVNEGYAPEQWFVSKDQAGLGYIGYLGNTQQFNGHIDGNGYAVHGLYYELGNTSTLSGLIPYVGGTVTVKDLGIEDSFIGSGRFTGGLIGYTTSSAKVTISGTYIDDSCAVWGWDAGAAYVDADGDIHTSGGNGLCLGKLEYGYNESATGTYVKSGDGYHVFSAADYEGTKYAIAYAYVEDEAGAYKYDEENDTYVEIGAEETFEGTRYTKTESGYAEDANGTFLLDVETYREITIADYTGTRYEQDKVWSGVNFTSEALGGLVGRFENGSTGTLENCFVTADVASHGQYRYGFNYQGVTFKNPGTNGAEAGHSGGIWGDDWATTKHVTATNCFSVIRPHENDGNATFNNVYTLGTPASGAGTQISAATGENGLAEMVGFDANVWYAVKAEGAYPALRVRGTAINDVDENGVGGEETDLSALRVVLIKNTALSNGDVNRNGETDICDLVAFSKK